MLWLTGWCASEEQLDQNWENLELAFTLDGEEVPLNKFSDLETTAGGHPCRFYYVLLTDWPVGEHVVITEMKFAEDLNDGIETRVYAAGSRLYEYHVYVTR